MSRARQAEQRTAAVSLGADVRLCTLLTASPWLTKGAKHALRADRPLGSQGGWVILVLQVNWDRRKFPRGKPPVFPGSPFPG